MIVCHDYYYYYSTRFRDSILFHTSGHFKQLLNKKKQIFYGGNYCLCQAHHEYPNDTIPRIKAASKAYTPTTVSKNTTAGIIIITMILPLKCRNDSSGNNRKENKASIIIKKSSSSRLFYLSSEKNIERNRSNSENIALNVILPFSSLLLTYLTQECQNGVQTSQNLDEEP